MKGGRPSASLLAEVAKTSLRNLLSVIILNFAHATTIYMKGEFFFYAFLLRMKKSRESLWKGKFGHIDFLFC